MIALKRMANFGWAFLVCLAAIPVYFLNVYVGPLRTELREVDQKIEVRKRQIAYLEAELAARASVERLHQYNDVLYGYQPPRPDQYLHGEGALARLGAPGGKRAPVMVSVATDDAAPAGVIGSVVPQPSDAAPPARNIAASLVEEAHAAEAGRLPEKAKSAATAGAEGLSSASARKELERTERMAAIDRQLLSNQTLSNISVEAQKEKARP